MECPFNDPVTFSRVVLRTLFSYLTIQPVRLQHVCIMGCTDLGRIQYSAESCIASRDGSTHLLSTCIPTVPLCHCRSDCISVSVTSEIFSPTPALISKNLCKLWVFLWPLRHQHQSFLFTLLCMAEYESFVRGVKWFLGSLVREQLYLLTV